MTQFKQIPERSFEKYLDLLVGFQTPDLPELDGRLR